VLLIDPRLGLTELDEVLLDVIRPRVAEGLKFLVLLTKADKLGRNESAQALATARRVLAGRATVQMFSAESGEGVSAAQGALEAMLSGHVKTPGDP
jgi:GTP-binding protein